MPGLEGDLEEWQTQEVTRGEAEGDIDLVLLFPTVLHFHAHINIHYFYPNTLVFVGDNTTRSIRIYLY